MSGHKRIGLILTMGFWMVINIEAYADLRLHL